MRELPTFPIARRVSTGCASDCVAEEECYGTLGFALVGIVQNDHSKPVVKQRHSAVSGWHLQT